MIENLKINSYYKEYNLNATSCYDFLIWMTYDFEWLITLSDLWLLMTFNFEWLMTFNDLYMYEFQRLMTSNDLWLLMTNDF